MAIAAMASAFLPGVASAKTELGGTVGVRTQYSKNPFQVAGRDTEAGAVTVTLAPEVTTRMARGDLRLGGRIDFSQYTRLYGHDDSYLAEAELTQKLDARLKMRAGAGFSSAVEGGDRRNRIGFGTDIEPNLGVPLPGEDITLNGRRLRRNTFNASIGFEWQPDAKNSWKSDSAILATRYPGSAIVRDFTYATQRIGYLRKLNSSVSLGGSANVARTDYRANRVGDATSYGGQADLAVRLNANWELSVGGGVTLARIRQLTGTRETTSFSGSFNLCSKGNGSRFCTYAARSVLPTALGFVRPQTTGGMQYFKSLTSRSDISADASYSRATEAFLTGGVTSEFLRGNVTYSNRFTEQLRGYVGFGYSDTFRQFQTRRSNPSVSAGIVLALGLGR